MQRKNSRVMHTKGFAMIMAIAAIIIVSTILALSLSLSSQTTKQTADIYLYEQAKLLSRAAAEYAVLELSYVNPCSLAGNELDFRYNNTFDVNISLAYIPFAGSDCDSNASAVGAELNTTSSQISDGTVIIDVAVTANPSGVTEPLRYFRRTLQKL